MSGSCIGLSACEIKTAMELHAVPRKRWRSLAADLALMGNAAAGYYAEKAKKEKG